MADFAHVLVGYRGVEAGGEGAGEAAVLEVAELGLHADVVDIDSHVQVRLARGRRRELDHDRGRGTQRKERIICLDETLTDHLKQPFISPEHEVLWVLCACGALEASLAPVFLVQSDLSIVGLEFLQPFLGLVLQVCPQLLRGQAFQVGFQFVILLCLDLAARLACGEGSVLHAVLKLDALGVRPSDIIAESVPIMLEESLDIVSEAGLLHFSLHERVDVALGRLSCLLPLRAVVIVEGEHVVVGPAVHLNREDGRLERESLEPHLVDPRAEVKAIDWRHGIVLLALLDLVVVLTWWIETQEHGLGAQDGGVVPRRLNVDLGYVVELVHESVGARLTLLLLDVPVAQLIADHVLLADAERRDVVCELWLLVFGSREVQQLRWGMRSLRADLVHVLDVTAGATRVRHGVSLGPGG